MPQIRYYVVQQIREVSVQASGIVDAVRIAEAALENKDIPAGIWGNTRGNIKVLNIQATEET